MRFTILNLVALATLLFSSSGFAQLRDGGNYTSPPLEGTAGAVSTQHVPTPEPKLPIRFSYPVRVAFSANISEDINYEIKMSDAVFIRINHAEKLKLCDDFSDHVMVMGITAGKFHVIKHADANIEVPSEPTNRTKAAQDSLFVTLDENDCIANIWTHSYKLIPKFKDFFAQYKNDDLAQALLFVFNQVNESNINNKVAISNGIAKKLGEYSAEVQAQFKEKYPEKK